MSVYGCDGLEKVRCALLCVASDVPAARKGCGFLGHSGCSQCKKEFPGGLGEPKDYSGFERDKWPPKRSNHDHRILGEPKDYSGFVRYKWPPKRSNHDHRAKVDFILKERAITRWNTAVDIPLC